MFSGNVPHLHKYPKNTVLLSKAAFRMYVIVDREKGMKALSVRAAFDRVEKTYKKREIVEILERKKACVSRERL